MAVSPSTQDKRGILLANSTLPTYDSNYPAGDRPAGGGGYSDADYPPIPSTEPSLADQRFVGGAGANDSNDGTFGSPWATFEKAVLELCASSTWYCLNLSADITVSTTFSTKSQGAGPGTISQFAYIRRDPAVPSVNLTLDATVQVDGQSHWLWHNFNVISNSFGVWFGQDLAMSRQCIRNMTGGMNGLGGDNIAFFYTENSNLSYFGAFSNVFTGPGAGGGVQGNTAGILAFGVDQLRWENNEVSGFPRPLYFKHANTGLTPDVHIRHNYHKSAGAGESCFFAGQGNSGTYEVINNIFDSQVELSNGGGGAQVNTIEFKHNTVKGQLRLNYFDGGSPVLTSLVQDNIITEGYYLQEFLAAQPNSNASNWNLYGDVINYLNSDFTLASWQAGSTPAGQDVNSIAGLPTFTGGASPTTIAGFALNGGNGVNAASDGTDMGADVSTVGA